MFKSHPVLVTAVAALSCATTAITASPAAARSAHHRRAARVCSSETTHRPPAARACRVKPRPAAPQRGVKHQRTSAGRRKVSRPLVRRVPTPAATRAGAQAATIANVLATVCQNTELVPEPGNLALVRAAVLCLINRERAQHGETPLALDPRLDAAAEEHSRELVSQNYFAHVAPDGTTPVDRIRRTGYIASPSAGYVIGENLAWGTLDLSTPQSIVAAWIASPGHLANILESQYQDTGIGVAPAVPASLSGGQPGATYAQEFGVIVN